jgi:hypothetical protein
MVEDMLATPIDSFFNCRKNKGIYYMKDLYRVITRDDAIERFEAFELQAVIDEYEQDGEVDGPARREAWNDWTDMLCKDGEISDWQYENWTQPECCERNVYHPSRIFGLGSQ